MSDADKHYCPAHGTHPIDSGAPDTKVNGLPVARVGDSIDCPDPNEITTGAATVHVNGRPIARILELSAHGGWIATGATNVRAGGPSTSASAQTAFGEFNIVADGEPLSGNRITHDEYLRLQAESLLPNKDWGVLDVAQWKAHGWLGGGDHHLRDYKDDWVRDHATSIQVLARVNSIPPELLAGTAWIEVGGAPTFIDDVAHDVYSFDHSGDPLLRPLTVFKEPNRVSAGDVSIQVRRAAEVLGLDPNSLGYWDRKRILSILKNDQANLALVARHLRQLADIDFADSEIGPEQMRVIGARYNRGPDLTLDEIVADTSYGDLIVSRLDDLMTLLSDASVGSRIVPAGPRAVARGQ